MHQHNVLKICWDTYLNDILKLSKTIKIQIHKENKTKELFNIIAISRGGLIPATIISHNLKKNFHQLYCLGLTSYNNIHKKNQIKMYQDIDDINWDYNVIVIDDLIDSGKTLQYVYEKYTKSAIFGVLYNKINCNDLIQKISNLHIVENISFDCWVQFPYEPS